jgi:hypothetical protein
MMIGQHSHATALRFLRARKFVVKDAYEMFCASLDWRMEYGVAHNDPRYNASTAPALYSAMIRGTMLLVLHHALYSAMLLALHLHYTLQ